MWSWDEGFRVSAAFWWAGKVEEDCESAKFRGQVSTGDAVMRAIVLAAGRGSRLHPYTVDKPKCLLPVGGCSILERQVRMYQSLGIHDIVVIKGYKEESINIPGVRYYVNRDYSSTNMMYSLFSASAELEGDVVVSYSDVIFASRVLRSLVDASDRDILVVGDVMWQDYYRARFGDPLHEAESFVCGPDRRILEIGASNPQPKNVHARYAGLIRLSPIGCQLFRETYERAKDRYWNRVWQRGRVFQQCYMTDFLQAVIDEGIPIHCFPIERGWLEFDNVSDYDMVTRYIDTKAIESFCEIDGV